MLSQNDKSLTPETDQQSQDQANPKKPGLRQKRLLKRQDAIDLSEKSSSSESGADDDSEERWEEFGNSDSDFEENDITNKDSKLGTESLPKKRRTTNCNTTRKLTRQNVVDIDLVFKHKTSMIEPQLQSELTSKKPQFQLSAGKKSSLTHRKRGKSHTNASSYVSVENLIRFQKKSGLKQKE